LDEKFRDHRVALICSRGRALLRVDLLAWNGIHDAADDDTIVLGKALIDHPHLADDLSGLDLTLLDDAVLVDHQHVTAALVAAERDIGHQQHRAGPGGDPDKL